MQQIDSSKRQRSGTPITSGQMDKKQKRIVLRNLSAVITADSELGENKSADSSRFMIPMERASLNIPTHATNVTAALVKACIINKYTPPTDIPNPLFIETNFTNGGVNPRGDISSILSMIPHTQGNIIIYETGTPVRIPCSTVLKGSNPQALEFRLVDKNSNGINMAQNNGGHWQVQVLIEWEQEVAIDYLKSSPEETQYY